MNAESSHPNDPESQPFSFDPFPEPRTYPCGWFMEPILESRTKSSLQAPAPGAKPESWAKAPSEDQTSESKPDWHEKFSELRTCPPGWRMI